MEVVPGEYTSDIRELVNGLWIKEDQALLGFMGE
jgi:hypothetical protein